MMQHSVNQSLNQSYQGPVGSMMSQNPNNYMPQGNYGQQVPVNNPQQN